jgi:hypothetical protein
VVYLKKGGIIMFSTGLIISAGGVVVAAIVEKIADQTGIHWLGTATRLIIPLVGLGFAAYFLTHNPMLRWLR